jgi:hypothetical protein
MLTDIEIRLLKDKARRLPNLFWRDPDGLAHRVTGVNLKWVEDPNEPSLTEPVAVLASGRVVALYNTELESFFLSQPLVLGQPHQATLFVDRMLDSLALLCNGQRPSREMVEAWFKDESEALQDWAVNHAAPYWATGIGVIDAATALAESPEEGISGGNGGPEHQLRHEVF